MVQRRHPYNIGEDAAVTGAPPTGPAGGDLTGTYPNPTIKQITGVAGSVTIPGSLTFAAAGGSTIALTIGGSTFFSIAAGSAVYGVNNTGSAFLGSTTVGFLANLNTGRSTAQVSSGQFFQIATQLTVGLKVQITDGGDAFTQVPNTPGGADIAAVAGGPLFYGLAGALKGRGTGGTLTVMAPADLKGFGGHCPCCGTDYALEYENPRYGLLTVCVRCLVFENLVPKSILRRVVDFLRSLFSPRLPAYVVFRRPGEFSPDFSPPPRRRRRVA